MLLLRIGLRTPNPIRNQSIGVYLASGFVPSRCSVENQCDLSIACPLRDLAQCLAFGRPHRLNRAAPDQQSYDLFTAAPNGVGQRSVPWFSVPRKQPVVAES